MKVYLVRAFWGQYSDKGERIERVFSTRKKAIDYIEGQSIDVYEEDGDTYACWSCDKPTGTAHPKWNGYAWRYEVVYSLDTSSYQIIEMEVDDASVD